MVNVSGDDSGATQIHPKDLCFFGHSIVFATKTLQSPVANGLHRIVDYYWLLISSFRKVVRRVEVHGIVSVRVWFDVLDCWIVAERPQCECICSISFPYRPPQTIQKVLARNSW